MINQKQYEEVIEEAKERLVERHQEEFNKIVISLTLEVEKHGGILK